MRRRSLAPKRRPSGICPAEGGIPRAGSAPAEPALRKGQGGRSGSNRHLRGSRPRMLAVTPRPPRENGRRDRLPATGGRDVTVRWLRSQLLPIGAPASACPRRHPLTGRPWGLVGASCTLGPALCPALVPSLPRPARRRVVPVDGAGGIRTHGLELMRLARTASPLPRAALERARVWSAGFEPAISDARSRWGGHLPYDQSYCDTSPAGLEPATRGVEALCSSAELRGDRRHSVSDFSRTPALPSPIDDRGIEPRSTASSERRLPSRPVVGVCSRARFRRAESCRSDPRLRRGTSLKAAASRQASPPQLRQARSALSCA